MEQIRSVTWDFGGARLYPFQVAQFLYKADPANGNPPFRDAKVLMTGCAIMYGESAGYLKAWHLNVVRDPEGNIVWDDDGKLTAKSCDLGWIQRNADFPDRKLLAEEVPVFVQGLFDSEQYGYLDRPALAAQEAAELYITRKWNPWVAFANGGYKRHLETAGLAVANFLAVEFGLGQSRYAVRSR